MSVMPGHNDVTTFEDYKAAWDALVQQTDPDGDHYVHPSRNARDCYEGAKRVQFSRGTEVMRSWSRFGNHAVWKAEHLWEDHDYDITDAWQTAEAHYEALKEEKGAEHRTTKHWMKVAAVLGHVRFWMCENGVAGESWDLYREVA